MSIIALILCIGCTDSKRTSHPALDFPETIKAVWTEIDNDNLFPNVWDISICDSSIFVISYLDRKWLHEYSLQDGNFINSYIPKGQGPDEIVIGESLQSDGNTVIIYDTASQVINSFEKGANEFHKVSSISLRSKPAVWNAWILSDSLILTRGVALRPNKPISRGLYLCRLDSTDEEPNDIFSYKTIPSSAADSPLAVCLESVSTHSPDRRRFATATCLGGILELFDVKSDSIIPITDASFFKIKINEAEIDYSETDYGFSSLISDNDYIYGAYSGAKDGNGQTRIGIWKWDGSPVKLIETDAQILKMALSDDSKTMYAITKKENDEIRISKLNL